MFLYLEFVVHAIYSIYKRAHPVDTFSGIVDDGGDYFVFQFRKQPDYGVILWQVMVNTGVSTQQNLVVCFADGINGCCLQVRM